jgi:hypothetical protein
MVLMAAGGLVACAGVVGLSREEILSNVVARSNIPRAWQSKRNSPGFDASSFFR